jgi:uncharacterized protein (TIGR01319 family)
MTQRKSNHEMEYILATDVGSTTTKARFFRKMGEGEWRFVVAGETPTTVEAPYEDVTMGVKNAVREVEELTGHKILAKDGEGIITPYNGVSGVDLYCTTSSAGGGLQMMVTGVIKRMTGESAERSALGAGAIVMEIFATNDKRPVHRKIQQIRNLRPDMILMAGGPDGGTISHVVNMAELIKSADPKPRLGAMYKLPIVYAGNNDAVDNIEGILGKEFALSCIENIRPVLEVENTEPARRAIHELFMEHVMSHAPGYGKLMKWTDVDIMPTPAGEGMAIQLIADRYERNVIGVGLGGATTNIYSIFDKRFVRSVSANLGMSYSICNVLKETGLENIMRWLPFDIDSSDVRNRLRNKMIRPTTIPQTLQELVIEHAVAREALRLGLVHHTSIATTLKGVRGDVAFLRGITTQAIQESYLDMMEIDIVAGTGGLLSHAPRRVQSLMILNDAFQTEGVTMMFQDSVFMMPHLGVVSTVYRDAAWQIFDLDCLVRLGTIVAPKGETDVDEVALDITLEMPDGDTVKESLNGGEVKKIALPERQVVQATIQPGRDLDIGAGPGQELVTSIEGGVVGVVLDTRGRPLVLPGDSEARKAALLKWIGALDMYPEKIFEEEA